MIKHLKAYVPPRCERSEWQEEHVLCSSDIVETEDFDSLTTYEW